MICTNDRHSLVKPVGIVLLACTTGMLYGVWLESIACLQDSTTSSVVCIQVMQLRIIGCEVQ